MEKQQINNDENYFKVNTTVKVINQFNPYYQKSGIITDIVIVPTRNIENCYHNVYFVKFKRISETIAFTKNELEITLS